MVRFGAGIGGGPARAPESTVEGSKQSRKRSRALEIQQEELTDSDLGGGILYDSRNRKKSTLRLEPSGTIVNMFIRIAVYHFIPGTVGASVLRAPKTRTQDRADDVEMEEQRNNNSPGGMV